MDRNETIYGTRAVMEAIKSGREIEKIFIQSGLTNNLIKELIATARDHKAPYSFIPQQKLAKLSAKNHQGVVCLLSAIRYVPLQNLIDKAYSEGRSPFLLIVDRVTDVRNFGAIARTAECAGLDGIVIEAKGNAPITGDAVKTSAGALSHLPVSRVQSLPETLKLLKANGIQIVACTEKAQQTIYDIDLKLPTALVLGSEEDGISDEVIRLSDHLAKIPMKGKIASLNVSVAAGIAIYETVRQQRSPE